MTYALTTLALSWCAELFVIANGGVRSAGLLFLIGLMWIPGALALLWKSRDKALASAPRTIPAPDFSAKCRAIITPILLSILTSLICVALRVRSFQVIPGSELFTALPTILITLVAGLIGAIGEELGWRGYLLPKLIENRNRRPYALTGMIWAIWHLPLVMFGGYYESQNVALIALTYSSSILAINAVACELRVRSGSVVPPILLHAFHNFFFQLAVPRLLITGAGPHQSYWETLGGDTGLIPAALYALTYLAFFKSPATHARACR